MNRCVHRVEQPYGKRGDCTRCGTAVVANGCGPGFIEADRLADGSGWHVCSDGLARWFGQASPASAPFKVAPTGDTGRLHGRPTVRNTHQEEDVNTDGMSEVERWCSIHPRVHAARIVHEALAERRHRQEMASFRAYVRNGLAIRRYESRLFRVDGSAA